MCEPEVAIRACGDPPWSKYRKSREWELGNLTCWGDLADPPAIGQPDVSIWTARDANRYWIRKATRGDGERVLLDLARGGYLADFSRPFSEPQVPIGAGCDLCV